MLFVKESNDACIASLTLVKTAAPNAMPISTVAARTGCRLRFLRLNQQRNRKKKIIDRMVDAGSFRL
jgi:hypothetical protein